MCGPTKAPPVVKDDPVADQAKADALATAKSNADLAARRRRLAANSLMTLGAQGTSPRSFTTDNLLASIDQGLVLPTANTDPVTGGSGGSMFAKKRDAIRNFNLGDSMDPVRGFKDIKTVLRGFTPFKF